jgi:two-component system sensor histidine kinase KdpD
VNDDGSDQVCVPARSKFPGLLIWLVTWLVLATLHGQFELATLALLLVLASALASLWLRPVSSLLASAVSVLGFNFAFVPPRGRFSVDLFQHAMLLATVLVVSWIVALLMTRQRALAVSERAHALRARQLQDLGEALRDVDDPASKAGLLGDVLSSLVETPVTLLLHREPIGASTSAEGADANFGLDQASPDEREGLLLSGRRSIALGPGTGRYEEQAAWYLPMRGHHESFGAALLPLPGMPVDAERVRAHAQALCDQMGLALERASAFRAAAAAREEAQAQKLRNTLLAAISHDYRTPLATILGAASSLHDQAERLSAEQRTALAATIVDEAHRLSQLADNLLQLARLDAPGTALKLDWESVEEIVGTVLRRHRQRRPAGLVHARIERGLPLLHCDAVLLVQLLDNLVDNALEYGGDAGPVEIEARQLGERVVLAVRDRGPGIAPEMMQRVFLVFERGERLGSPQGEPDSPARRGAGVGLALCRAIARAHGGELRLRLRRHGGCSFECELPVQALPPIENGVVEAPGS